MLSVCHWESDGAGGNRFPHLGEERACHELLVLQEGDALAAVQLLGEVRHVRLQLGEACKHRHVSPDATNAADTDWYVSLSPTERQPPVGHGGAQLGEQANI